jgi:hypothetical protein
LRDPIGESATSRAAAHDDVIEAAEVFHLKFILGMDLKFVISTEGRNLPHSDVVEEDFSLWSK